MMHLKLLGAAMTVGACGWAGMREARRLRLAQRHMTELISALDTVECEIRFARTGCAELFLSLSELCRGETGGFFLLLSQACSGKEEAGPGMTVRAMRRSGLRLPEEAQAAMERLFDRFGSYDAEGQLRMLSAARSELEHCAVQARAGLAGRCRTCAVLGLCTGAALIILVI